MKLEDKIIISIMFIVLALVCIVNRISILNSDFEIKAIRKDLSTLRTTSRTVDGLTAKTVDLILAEMNLEVRPVPAKDKSVKLVPTHRDIPLLSLPAYVKAKECCSKSRKDGTCNANSVQDVP